MLKLLVPSILLIGECIKDAVESVQYRKLASEAFGKVFDKMNVDEKRNFVKSIYKETE